MFIVVLEAGGIVVNNGEDLHRKSIEQAAFFDFNHFFRMVIHKRTFGKFFYVLGRRLVHGDVWARYSCDKGSSNHVLGQIPWIANHLAK